VPAALGPGQAQRYIWEGHWDAALALLVTGVEQPEHRRLLNAYATWRVLRRLRQRASQNTTGRTPTGDPRTQLLAATRFLTRLDHTGVTMAQCRQTTSTPGSPTGPHARMVAAPAPPLVLSACRPDHQVSGSRTRSQPFRPGSDRWTGTT
jgi:hypothetical protein